ncbi:glycosyltransferase [Altererythrobacter sp. TH136]|uniref:glycosyltransferase n=1 Tax=Altererythrobacter sp. TH136 TaxID=2067415 RepID=UPI001162FB68|nr:glycosyltransferase [Altererythrobacter sp. TH136]QDM40506.1 glycosyltransferase [Altererythrobacter sp. TH136]
MSAANRAPTARILHLHSTFSAGGKERRAVRLMNAFGPRVAHTVVTGVLGETGAARELSRALKIAYPTDFPALAGRPTPARLQKIARAMQGHDLVLTYNWGALDAVMAHTLFADFYRLPPLIHHEDGFNADEQGGLKKSRNWYRRIALGRARALVVPSEVLEEIALTAWAQPLGRVHRIPNGIDTAAFAKKPRADALQGIIKRKGELWVGTLAGMRPVKNLPGLVRAFAPLPAQWQLVIVGDGPERAAIRAEAERLGIEDRVHLPGFAPDPARFVGLFDIFALSSHSEQFPLSLVEAMAAGIAVAAPAVGDIADMVSPDNQPFITPRADEAALSGTLAALAVDTGLRNRLGQSNRLHARAHFEERAMIEAYRRLYAAAMGRESLP